MKADRDHRLKVLGGTRRPLVALAGQGKVKLRSSSYPLEAAGDAVEDLRHGRIHGRAILTPG